MNYLLLLIPIAIIILLGWALYNTMKQSKKDWETLDYLKDKATKVNTKEEIEDFHKEFREKASKIYNKFIALELNKIDGYLRGLYKQFK